MDRQVVNAWKCAEAVSLFIHQLTEPSRAHLVADETFRLPLLHPDADLALATQRSRRQLQDETQASGRGQLNWTLPAMGDLPCSDGHQNVPYPVCMCVCVYVYVYVSM